MSTETQPQTMWRIARVAAAAGYDVAVEPRGSSYALKIRRPGVEVAARWRQLDRDAQGDSAGRWIATGRASATVAGAHQWIALADLPDWLTSRQAA